MLVSTEHIIDDFDLKKNCETLDLLEEFTFPNNQTTNSVLGIYKLFFQDLLEVFLLNFLLKIINILDFSELC